MSLLDTLLGRPHSRGSSPLNGTASQTEQLFERYDPRLDAVGDRTGEPALSALSHPHIADPHGADRAAVRDQALAYRDQGVGVGGFVASYGVVTDALVAAAFDTVRDAVETEAAAEAVDRAESQLAGALDETLDGMSAGVTAATQQAVTDGGVVRQPAGGPSGPVAPEPAPDDSETPDNEGLPVDTSALLDHVGTAIFMLDTDGDVVCWNSGAEELTGVSAAEAREVEMASEAFYHDNRRAQTLADKVLEAPEAADDEHGVPRVDAPYTLYRDRSTMVDADGETRHISFSAAPVYEDSEGRSPSDSRTQSGDGELVGVVEMVQDRTDDTVRRDRTADLLAELQWTIGAIQDGQYDARAEFDHQGVVDEELVGVVDSLNDLAEQFEVLSTEVREEVSALHDSAETVTERSMQIGASASQQTETMRQLSTEVSNLSAAVEEVASGASQVDATSDRAEALAREGQQSAEEAVSLMADVEDSADTVRDDVTHLQSRITEINDIVEVINDIADQTNILALNASIEAARAGEAGEGFAVVAEEVKSLAERSQQNATEIESLIDGIQTDTDETVDNLETTTDHIDEVIGEVEEAMHNLSDITEAVTEASEGVQEVADATNDQAASTEEVASMVDEAAESAELIASDVEEIAEANRDQQARADDIRAMIETQSF